VEPRRDPDQLRKDEAHRRIAARIRRDPGVIALAAARLEQWLAADPPPPDPALLEWKAALEMLDPADLADFLESPTPRAARMRISSPFFGLDR
jgi:hypothetical protein